MNTPPVYDTIGGGYTAGRRPEPRIAARLAAALADADSGEWQRRYGHLLALDELDLGYRVLIARPHQRV